MCITEEEQLLFSHAKEPTEWRFLSVLHHPYFVRVKGFSESTVIRYILTKCQTTVNILIHLFRKK